MSSLILLSLAACGPAAPPAATSTVPTAPTPLPLDTGVGTGGGTSGGNNGVVATDAGELHRALLTIDGVEHLFDPSLNVVQPTVGYTGNPSAGRHDAVSCVTTNYFEGSWVMDDGVVGRIAVPTIYRSVEDPRFYLEEGPRLPMDPVYPQRPPVSLEGWSGHAFTWVSGGTWWAEFDGFELEWGVRLVGEGASLCHGLTADAVWTMEHAACDPVGRLSVELVGHPAGGSVDATHRGLLLPTGERLCVHDPELAPASQPMTTPPSGTGGTGGAGGSGDTGP